MRVRFGKCLSVAFLALLFVILAMAFLAIAVCRTNVKDDPPPLASASGLYWNALVKSGRGFSLDDFFPGGLPKDEPFALWLVSTTNEVAREQGVHAVLSVDRAGATEFLEWMYCQQDAWRRCRSFAFHDIAATSPFWATNRPSRWSPVEIKAFSAFFRRHFPDETDYQCRLAMDSFFERVETGWKASDERLRFLERSLSLCTTSHASNPILRRIESRFDPDDMENYYRSRVQW